MDNDYIYLYPINMIINEKIKCILVNSMNLVYFSKYSPIKVISLNTSVSSLSMSGIHWVAINR